MLQAADLKKETLQSLLSIKSIQFSVLRSSQRSTHFVRGILTSLQQIYLFDLSFHGYLIGLAESWDDPLAWQHLCVKSWQKVTTKKHTHAQTAPEYVRKYIFV